MADDQVIAPPVQTQVAPDSGNNQIPDSLRQEMARALGGFNGNAPYKEPDQQDQSVITDNQQGQPDNSGGTQTAPPAQGSAVDPFSSLKEKFGYQSPEEAFKEIEELRALKNAPPAQQKEYEFANEQSKKLFEAYAKGNHKEVLEYLRQEEELGQYASAEVTKENAADIIKLGLRIKHKDLSPQEIEWQFKKQYGIPKEPVMAADEEKEEFEERHEAWKEKVMDAEMSRLIDAKLLKPEIESAKSKLVVPEIDSDVDEGYAHYQEMMKNRETMNAENDAAYKAMDLKALALSVDFIDEANKINTKFQFEPDADSFAKVQAMTTDPKLYEQAFLNSDGTPNRQKFLQTLYYGLNISKIVGEAIKHGKNATIRASLPDNSGNTMQRLAPDMQEPSEFDKQMKRALQGNWGR